MEGRVCGQDVICVLGMHRSGTSLLTRILNIIGVQLGSEAGFMKPGADNPKGYWEHLEVCSINEAILKRHGGSWDEPPLLPPGWETAATIDDLRHRAQQFINKQFAEVQLWGWKDPRSCLTLPFWQQLLPEMRYIICLRNPVDVARSLATRNSLSAEMGSNLWLNYVSSALNHTEGKPRLMIFYEDVMDDCLRELQRLAAFLGKPERAQQVEVQEAVQEFIEMGLQHYRASIVQATASSRIDVRAKALYLAKRISVSFGRKEINGRQGLDNQIYKALDVLSQYSSQASGQANPLVEQLAELEDQSDDNRRTIRSLQASMAKQGQELETVAVVLNESEQALKTLSTQLVEKDGIIEARSRDLAEQARALKTLSTQLVKKDGIIEARSRDLAEQARALKTLSTQLVEKDGIIEARSTDLAEQTRVLKTLSTQLVEKDGIIEARSTDLTEQTRVLKTLSTQLVEKDGIIQALSTELAQQTRALQWQAESIEARSRILSAQLLLNEAELQSMKDTLGWRLLSQYGRIKYGLLLPVWRLVGKLGRNDSNRALERKLAVVSGAHIRRRGSAA